MGQVYNPFLPLHEYIPDGEPHVFGERVYLYGSHDKEGGYTFCMQDYVVYSAPINDLSDWRYEGISYKACQDPSYPRLKYMYAPDVVQGNDDKFYLYYAMGGDYGVGGYTCPISVAVSDSPAGPFEFLGHVRYSDGTIMKKYICFDPAVLNDNGTIRLYYGTQYDYEERADFNDNNDYINTEMEMFGRSKDEILSYPDSIMGPVMVVLEDDMITVKEEAHHIIPYKVKGTSFESHPFFEGSSMRKVNGQYYFIYSSWQNHELCYATSDYPDKDFVFGGTIVSNGDISLNGRAEQDRLNMTGTTHGSIVEINGNWYVFYHRLTHKSDYSRQACAEKITINADGHIDQVEITSCGLNAGPLIANGNYPAVIACNITNGKMPHGSNTIYNAPFPNVTNLGEERFIGEISENTLIGYKYFSFSKPTLLSIKVRIESVKTKPKFDGPIRIDERCEKDNQRLNEYARQSIASLPSYNNYFDIFLDNESGEKIGRIFVPESLDVLEWTISENVLITSLGKHALYLKYHGIKSVQLKEICFC